MAQVNITVKRKSGTATGTSQHLRVSGPDPILGGSMHEWGQTSLTMADTITIESSATASMSPASPGSTTDFTLTID